MQLSDSYHDIVEKCRILRWVREEEDHIRENNETTIKCVILDLTGKLANINKQYIYLYQ